MSGGAKSEWFKDWFDSEFYHILYTNRDQHEADVFISNLLQVLAIQPGAKVLDLACGKGRHSLFLNQLGYDVLGVDLSCNSIGQAHVFENEHLHFQVGDMREPQGAAEFAAVFNLFTSFGYFESAAENLKTLNAIHQSLIPKGYLVIDFMNSTKAIANLVPHYTLERKGVSFTIEKSIENQVISKRISFLNSGKPYFFEERVQALELPDFERYFHQTGFQIQAVFGDYLLSPFDVKASDRMIFVARRIS